MNLTQPPFDDVHVRRAMNWVMDKAALVQGLGRSAERQGREPHRRPTRCSTTSSPSSRPYKTPATAAASAKAKAAMKGSKYDTKGDGTCSASACKDVLHDRRRRWRSTRSCVPVHPGERGEDRDHASRCGRSRAPSRRSRRPPKNIPIANVPRLGQGLRRPAHLLRAALRRPHDHPERQHQLLARRARRLRQAGEARASRAPSPASRASTPSSTAARRSSGSRGSSCYEALDRKLMTKVVPWIPYLWRSTVHIIEQAGDAVGVRPVRRQATAYAHVAVEVTGATRAACAEQLGAPSRSSRRRRGRRRTACRASRSSPAARSPAASDRGERDATREDVPRAPERVGDLHLAVRRA